jgi:hypothetical protein
MDDLTLDVCVLMSGSGTGNPKYRDTCLDLMKRMLNMNNYKLALDEKGKIKQQYLTKNGQGTFGHHFVIKMALTEKTVPIPWRNLRDSVRVKLDERGFTRDIEDYKYVICASGTCCNKLVSHEPHFFNVSHILRKVPVKVMLPHQT